MPRHVFPASSTHEDHLAWCRQRLAERLRIPEPLPTVRRPRPEPDAPLPEMFDRLPFQRKGERQRPPPPPAGTPLHVIVSSIFEGAISPPSPLALKRRERRAEREAAAKAAAREAKAAARAAKTAAREAETEPPAFLVQIGLAMLVGFKDLRGPKADEVLAALNDRRPPNMPAGERIAGIRSFGLSRRMTITLRLTDSYDAFVDISWDRLHTWFTWKFSSQVSVSFGWLVDAGCWWRQEGSSGREVLSVAPNPAYRINGQT